MDIVNSLLLWLHLLGLAMAGAAVIGGAAIALVLASANPEQRAVLFRVTDILTRTARAALVLLIVTGPLLLWLKYGGVAPSQAWFGIKMLFVLIVIVALVVNGIGFRRLRNGDAAAQPLTRNSRLIGSAALVIVVLAAAFAFG